MEDTHGEVKLGNLIQVCGRVLILIIMEDTHGEKEKLLKVENTNSLNPYYNGRYSWRNQKIESANVAVKS